MSEIDTSTTRVIQRVAELPDRTSPDDWPEAMLVTADELREIMTDEFGAGVHEDVPRRLRTPAKSVQLPGRAWQFIRHNPPEVTPMPTTTIDTAELAQLRADAKLTRAFRTAIVDHDAPHTMVRPAGAIVISVTELTAADRRAINTAWLTVFADPGRKGRRKR